MNIWIIEKLIKALISLLDDEDNEVLLHVEEKIMSMGEVIIPFLESEWETNFDAEVQRRIEELIHNLQLKALRTKILDWEKEEEEDLLKGACLIDQIF